MERASVPLAHIYRGESLESVHFGQAVVVDSLGRILHAWGDASAPTFLRSSAKPFQAMTTISLGADEQFSWTCPERAVIISSHDASAEHLAIVEHLLRKGLLEEDSLRCGPHPPINGSTRDALIRAGVSPRPIHNNCSGKHAGMLMAARTMGWSIEEYEKPDHPLQQANAQTIGRLAQIDPKNIPLAIDGCAVPTFCLPLEKIAQMYARLVDDAGLDSRDQRSAHLVREAMQLHPELVSWSGHLTDKLGQHLGSRVISKGGAEGVFGIGLPEKGLGIAIKIIDGNPRALPAVVCQILSLLLHGVDWATMTSILNPPILNTRRDPVGRIEACFVRA
ncbi:asparaginase [bacterium]|jgi:L-asparaginase II|nr:asparaginase [bacterium]